MFLVVKPQCNSMEMNYLSTVWLQMSVGGQLFKRFGEEVFFLIFLPNIHFGVLSQSFNISNLFTLLPTVVGSHNGSHSKDELSEDCSEIKSCLLQSY